ncbi:MAG TPA: FecR domain-containing protein [Puia sp.]
MDDLSNSSKGDKELPFEFRARPVEEQMQEDNWKAVESAIRQPSEVIPVRSIPWGRVFTAAASMIAVAFGIWYIGTRTGTPQLSVLKTGYGEVKNILLPDSSVVILNANSSLRIQQQWTDGDSRQVWLEGEAYFKVQKKASTRQKFVVHTRELDVEVLGTKFNVNTRRQHSIVSLEEGKVQLSVHGNVQSVIEKKASMVLRPGQVVTLDESLQVKINEDKDVAAHSGWSRNEFHFDNTPLLEVARLIEDTYDYKMEARDTSLFRLSISGDLRAANVQELVKVLEVTLKLNMRIQNKTIYITNP